MKAEFNHEDLEQIFQDSQETEEQTTNQDPEETQEQAPEQASEEAIPEDGDDLPQAQFYTNFTMTVDQSIYATVEPGSAPLLRSSTTADNAKLFNALNGSSENVKDWLGEEVDVIAIVITSADVPSVMGDEDSERVCKPCVHFFTLDGTHISSISNGIIRATKMLLACGLTPTEETPIRIVFKEVSTKKGTAHTFDMV